MTRHRVVLASFDPVPAPKGASRHIQHNLHILSEDHDVSLVTLGERPLEGARHLVVDVQEPNWLRRAGLFHERVREIFARHAFDTYHVRTPLEGLAVPGGGDHRLLYEVNAFYSVELLHHHPQLVETPSVRRKFERMEDALLGRADLMLTPSPVTAQHVVDRGVSPDRVRVVPNAPSFAPLPAPAPSEHDGPLRLVYIGTLASWQGIVEAVDVVARMTTPIELTILTHASRRGQRLLRRRLRKRDLEATFLAPLQGRALRDFLVTQDLALAPLTPCARNIVQGCMPIKLLDYMAAGLPVLASDLEVVTQILGEAHPLYRSYSRQSMQRLMETLLSDRQMRHELGAANLERVTRLFGADVSRRALLDAYLA